MSRPLPKNPDIKRRMQRQARADTAPELAVRRAVRASGHHYRVAARLPGSPDLSNRGEGWAIFVHGCYWHHHEGCRRATIPKNNREWWIAKFAANRERDARKVSSLEALGMRVLVVWECECSDPALADRVKAWLEEVEPSAAADDSRRT